MTTSMMATGPTLDPRIVQEVLLGGDLARLTPEQRISFYNRICESLGLNPLTQPFAYLRLNGREVLYAKKDATEQLRFLHNISIDPKGFTREVIEGVYVVTAPASMPNGRTDVSTGAVPIEGVKGEARANAMMKAETKAKRRVTLSICGLGMLDETEVDSIPGSGQREPLIVNAPPVVAALPAGSFRIETITPVREGQGAKCVLSDGREVWATGAQMVAMLEQFAQEGAALDLIFRTVKRRKPKEGEADTYEQIEEARRWRMETFDGGVVSSAIPEGDEAGF